MGICYSCFKGSTSDYETPDMETKRKQMAEAAERRLKEQESRGVKNPQQPRKKMPAADLPENSNAVLKWNVG